MLDNMKTLGFSWARALNPAFLLRSSYRSSVRRYEATRAGISLGVDAAWTALILVDCKAGRAGKDRAEDMSVPAEKAALCDGSQQRQLQAEASKAARRKSLRKSPRSAGEISEWRDDGG